MSSPSVESDACNVEKKSILGNTQIAVITLKFEKFVFRSKQWLQKMETILETVSR